MPAQEVSANRMYDQKSKGKTISRAPGQWNALICWKKKKAKKPAILRKEFVSPLGNDCFSELCLFFQKKNIKGNNIIQTRQTGWNWAQQKHFTKKIKCDFKRVSTATPLEKGVSLRTFNKCLQLKISTLSQVFLTFTDYTVLFLLLLPAHSYNLHFHK